MRSHSHLRLPLRLILAIGLIALVPVLPQHVLAQHEDHPGGSWVPEDVLERAVPLRQGIGPVHDPVTTSSPEAQSFYDQGLAYLQSFEWIEAARSFHQALRIDPQIAMAYVGLSDAYLGLADQSAATAALAKAQAFSAKVTPAERRRMEIRARQIEYLQSGGDLQKYFAYRKAITDAITETPADPWLWILRGFADEGSPLAHGQNGAADTIAFYQTALALSPDNFAAHHYLAHTYENIGRTQDALAQSEAYVRLAPMIPHAHHMRGHALRRLGRTDEAVAEFLKADQLENDYIAAERIPAGYVWHHAHNLSLLALSLQSLGQMKAAEQRFREAVALPAHNDLAEFNRREWPQFLLARGRNEEALAAANELTHSQWALARYAGHGLAGAALLRMGKLPEAQDELRQAEQESEQIPTSVLASLPDAGVLRAEILMRSGDSAKAEAVLKDVEQKLRAAPGPDSWSEALFDLESIADAARAAGDWQLAEYTARQMIDHDPSYAGGYYALGLVAEHNGDANASRQQFAAAEKNWAKADSDLPELDHIRHTQAATH